MKRWLSEPMLHFAVAGAALFAAYALVSSGRDHGAADISVHVGPTEVEWLRASWRRQWQREPTTSELGGLVTEYLKEELLVREARAMALDENDTIVRRRLAQKLEFIVQDTARLAEPGADELRRYFDAHQELFRLPARASFSQVYFSREQREHPEADAATALALLTQAGAPTQAATLGDSLMVEPAWTEVDEATVSAQFGTEFAQAVFALTPGAWQGPIESAFGLHLVRVDRIVPAAPRAFAEARVQVEQRWRSERERELGQRYFASLLDKYAVSIDASVKPLVGELNHSISGPMLADGQTR